MIRTGRVMDTADMEAMADTVTADTAVMAITTPITTT